MTSTASTLPAGVIDMPAPAHVASPSNGTTNVTGWESAVYAYQHCGPVAFYPNFPGQVFKLQPGGPYKVPSSDISSLWIPTGTRIVLKKTNGLTHEYGPFNRAVFVSCLTYAGFNDQVAEYTIDDPNATTTAAPVTTTPAPVTTTAAPVTTTAAPVTTTAAPIISAPTTTAPPVVTEAPCMRPEEGSTIMQSDTGGLYRFENGGLRKYASMDVYRSWGSPPYTVWTKQNMDRCFSKGPPVDTRVTTTPAPVPTSAPTHPPFTDSTIYVLVHADTYRNTGRLGVLSLNFGEASVEEFVFKDVAQAWFIHANGFLRNAAGDGLYLAGSGDCLVPTVESYAVSSATWTIRPTGTHQFGYVLESKCGKGLVAGGVSSGPVRSALSLSSPGDMWYIIPVGSSRTSA